VFYVYENRYDKTPERTHVPSKLSQVANANDGQEKEKMKAFTDVAAGHLEQIVLLKLLEDTSLQLHKLAHRNNNQVNPQGQY